MKEKNFKNVLPYGNYENVLLHICCAPDATYPVLYLRGRHYKVTGFFYNPNIHPISEYEKRLNEVKKLSELLKFPLLEAPYSNEEVKEWFNYIKGYEKEKEGGFRCYLCYKMRLELTAKVAKEKGFDYFTTTITISPHKNSSWVFEIAKELEYKYSIKFLYVDFKKRNGFKSSVILSKFFGLYRQNYCGCVFSHIEAEEFRKSKNI